MQYKLKDFCRVINGRAYKQDELLNDGKYLVLRVGNFFSSDRWYYSNLELDKDKYCNNGDLLFAWACSFGPRIWNGGDNAIFHYHIWKLEENPLIVNRIYLYYLLLFSVNRMTAGVHGSVMLHITKSEMENFEFDLPSLDIQNKISSLLSNIDGKIENNNQINRNLSEQAQALYKSWFIDYEPYGGVMPDDWKQGTLGDIAEIRTDAFRPDKNPDVVVEHYSIPALDERNYPVFEEASGIKSNKYFVTKNDVMFSKLNPDIKRIWRPYCLSEYPVCSTEYMVYRSYKPEYKDFVFSIIDSVPFLQHVCAHTSGSTNSRQRAIPTTTLTFNIAIPTEEVVKGFCNVVTPMYELIEKNVIENQSLAETRDRLLPKLMSGELDISDLEI